MRGASCAPHFAIPMLQLFGHHNRAPRGASKCFASSLKEAEFEKATKKSQVLNNSGSVRAMLQTRVAPVGVHASRAERNLGIDFTSGKRVFTFARRARSAKS